MAETIQISINVAYVLCLGILCVISLLIAIYYDQKKLLKLREQKKEPSPVMQKIVTRSGRVLVQRPKKSVVYNDDDKLWAMEQGERRGDDGPE